MYAAVHVKANNFWGFLITGIEMKEKKKKKADQEIHNRYLELW